MVTIKHTSPEVYLPTETPSRGHITTLIQGIGSSCKQFRMMSYSAFSLLTETKDFFVIRTKQRQLIVLDKYGFDGTDIAGFRAFMSEKCPHAKKKWHPENE